ncbi:tetratricopeptide repeat protein [Cystobacter ferrugineus]|uniref:tetratricopeptide repeat protein n=1 Tax=Cystobacter ferrugineus TaxID=83449 RepID=UPI000A9D62CB|nr:tetratricopeptide repeat protein [Cystobacter ferrugineus]
MKPVTEADIGPGGEAEWLRLRRQLELAEGFWLGFIFSPSPLSSGVLRRRTERLLRGMTRRLESFQPENPSDLKGVLSSLFAPDAASAGCSWVEALNLDPGDGAERPWREAWLELVSRINERRDALRRHLHGGLVLVAPPEMKLPMREAASDLWSIRALVVELPLVAESLLRESSIKAGFLSEQVEDGTRPESERLAEFTLAESERLLAKAVGDDPRQVEVLLGRVAALLSSGRMAEAVETARWARELAFKHSQKVPHLQAPTLHMLALAEKAHGDPAAAAEHLEQAVNVFGSRDNRYRVSLLDELASLAVWRGELMPALATYEESLALRRQLRAALGDTPEALRDLAISLDNVGGVRQRLGHLLAARAAYEESLALTRQLRVALGDAPKALRDLAISLNRVGEVHQRLGHLLAARTAYEESLALTRQLRAALGDTPAALRDLFVSLNKVGDMQQSLGHLPAARAAYEESLSLTRQLRSVLGDMPEALRDLFVSLNKVGGVQQSLGHLSEASAAYEEALSLVRQLHALMGDTPQTIEDLSICLDKVADIREALGDSVGAARVRGESQALRDRVMD